MLLLEPREGVLDECLVSCPSCPTLPTDVLAREERLGRAPDRRRAHERRECARRIPMIAALDNEKIISSQGRPLEEGEPDNV